MYYATLLAISKLLPSEDGSPAFISNSERKRLRDVISNVDKTNDVMATTFVYLRLNTGPGPSSSSSSFHVQMKQLSNTINMASEKIKHQHHGEIGFHLRISLYADISRLGFVEDDITTFIQDKLDQTQQQQVAWTVKKAPVDESSPFTTSLPQSDGHMPFSFTVKDTFTTEISDFC